MYVVYQAAQSYYRFVFGSNEIPRKLGANTLDNVEKSVHFNLKIDVQLTTSKNICTGQILVGAFICPWLWFLIDFSAVGN